MNKQELLTTARGLIESPDRWTRGSAAVNEAGMTCSVHAPDATRWCFMGALRRSAGISSNGVTLVRAVMRDLEDSIGVLYPDAGKCQNCAEDIRHCIAMLNDDIGYEAVMAVADHALAAYKEASTATILPFKPRAPITIFDEAGEVPAAVGASA